MARPPSARRLRALSASPRLHGLRSKDLRDHLLSEAKRADTAETSLAEARLAAQAAAAAEAEAKKRMEVTHRPD
jgi:hypothetical protein